MDRTFTNTDAIICWCFAIAEIIAFIWYACLTIPRLRRRIVSMGRLIPSVQMLVAGGGAPISYQINVHNTVPYQPVNPVNPQMYPPQPPPAGFYQPQYSPSDPPPYSSLPQK